MVVSETAEGVGRDGSCSTASGPPLEPSTSSPLPVRRGLDPVAVKSTLPERGAGFNPLSLVKKATLGALCPRPYASRGAGPKGCLGCRHPSSITRHPWVPTWKSGLRLS